MLDCLPVCMAVCVSISLSVCVSFSVPAQRYIIKRISIQSVFIQYDISSLCLKQLMRQSKKCQSGIQFSATELSSTYLCL